MDKRQLKPFQSNGTFRPIDTREGIRRTAIRGAGATIAGQTANFILSIGSVSVLARVLSPADFGVVAMVTTFGLLFRSFGFAGFTESIVQREGLTNSLASNLFWFELSIGAVLTLVFASAGPLMALFFHNGTVARVAVGISPMIIFGCLGWIHLALLQRAGLFKATSLINLFGQVVLVVVSIILAIEGWHYWALVWGIVAQSAATTAGAWLVCRWTPSWPVRGSGTRSGAKFAMNVYSHYAFNYLTRNTDNLLVGWRYGAQMLGFYKKAYDLFVLPESQLLSPLSVVVVSTLSRIREDREQFQRFFLGAISVLALLGMGIGADLALVGKDIIRLLFGPGWDEAGRIFALFGPGIGAMLLYNTHGWIHVSIGRPERLLFWGLIEFLCTATLFLLTLHWGPQGIAFAWTASFFLLMFPGFWYAGRPIGLGLGSIIGTIWKFFLASVVAGCTTALIVRSMPHLAMTFGAPIALVRIFVISSVYFSLYVGSVIAFHGGMKPLNEAMGLLRDLLPDRMAKTAARNMVDMDETEPAPVWQSGTR
ncbi:MAG TPA: lipopolysaccharide biosynthesis protein [Terriglobales bacterium]|jgi:PST family polysaccharide transporter|nr:lipopolysaccharide biosynthesis protein [Terriglobales bacterium]